MTSELIAHLETIDEPLFVARTGLVQWPDEAIHANAYREDPQAYALLAVYPGVRGWQRARILLQLLSSSWTPLDDSVRATLGRIARLLVMGLPAEHVLRVLLALRRRRANHKHVTRAAIRLLVEHPQAEELIRTHRRVLVACVEHALGKATARGSARQILAGAIDAEPGANHLRRALLRFAPDPGLAMTRFAALYRTPSPQKPAPMSPAAPALPTVDFDLKPARPDTVTATNRGDIAATLVHLHRGGSSAELSSALSGYVAGASQRTPHYPGSLALVLDRSRSMQGYGDREWAVASQAEALRLVLERCASQLWVVPVGERPDQPSTDLANGVLDALDHGPDLVAVLSDGYENVYPGDLARLTATLPQTGVGTPVVFCHTTFGHSDDLALRRPAPNLPSRAFWHQGDFAAIVLWLIAHTRTAAAKQGLREALLSRLALVEEQISATRPTANELEQELSA